VIDGLLQFAVSNLLLASLLGVVAYAIQRHGRYPGLAHLLWVLVLIKAVTPTLVVLPISIGLPGVSAAVETAPATTVASSAVLEGLAGGGIAASLAAHAGALLVSVWLIGSVVAMIVSGRRILRFERSLRHASSEAPAAVRTLAANVAFELGMRSTPGIYVSGARLSPMTWWTGGRVRVVLPTVLVTTIEPEQLRWVLAHELAHVQRRDHLVRWLEWLVSIALWWNPIVWWARRNLHLVEEDACDALVLQRVIGRPRSYAATLLDVVEIMAASGERTPAMATGLGAVETLEARFTRIISPDRRSGAPRLLVLTTGTTAVALLSLGFGVAAGETQAPAAAEAIVTTLPAPTVSASIQAEAPAEVDYARLGATLPAASDLNLFVGTAAANAFTGTAAGDTIAGHGGADNLGGGPGGDTIRGGNGPDKIRGGNGADKLAGNAGADTIGGGAGNDSIDGGRGNDIIQGGPGRDTIDAGAGDDIVRSWADGVPDQVDCGSGEDKAVIGSVDSAVHCEVVVVRDPS
jgi:beta-lactamase regulating signal transducer with metallopeptidase domain